MQWFSFAAMIGGAWLVGCGGDDGPATPGMDASTMPDAPVACTTCARDSECSDDVYCNGEEQCMEGCCEEAAALVDCDDGDDCTRDSCDEAAAECSYEAQDADMDGHTDAACGGDDCDDSDALRFLGAEEICDSGTNRDEDCDPTTIGFRDADGDDDVDDQCCNMQPGGELLCGDDCDDMARGVHPDAPEVCDGEDNDCDGTPDDGVLETFHRDADGDDFGIDGMDTEACTPPAGYTDALGDCDDTMAGVNPGAPDNTCDRIDNDCDTRIDEATGAEICDGFDNDCDMMRDEGYACALGDTQACRTSCDPAGMTTGTRTCMGGCAWGACVAPAETCNGRDDDCNGAADDGSGFDCARGASVPCATTCSGAMGTGTCTATCTTPVGAACTPPAEVCNGGDDDCDGLRDETFPCVAGATGLPCTTGCGTPGTRMCSPTCTLPATCTAAAETCNGCDDTGDGRCDEGAGLCCRGVDARTETLCGGIASCRRTCDTACGWAAPCTLDRTTWEWSATSGDIGHDCGAADGLGLGWTATCTAAGCRIARGPNLGLPLPEGRYRAEAVVWSNPDGSGGAGSCAAGTMYGQFEVFAYRVFCMGTPSGAEVPATRNMGRATAYPGATIQSGTFDVPADCSCAYGIGVDFRGGSQGGGVTTVRFVRVAGPRGLPADQLP